MARQLSQLLTAAMTVMLLWLLAGCGSSPQQQRSGDAQQQEVMNDVPNGKIAFAGILRSDSATTNNWEIYTVNADGSKLAKITNNTSIDVSPAWSPDGEKIAFMRNIDGDEDIYVMNADGTEQKRLTDSGGDDSFPAWSPDGKKIAFTSNRAYNIDIFIMDADGDNVTRLTNNARYNVRPSWSPSGTEIAFQSTPPSDNTVESNEIYTINVDGTGEKALTNNQTGDSGPEWSPDGRRIVFQGSTGIHIMNANGTEQSPVQSGGTDPSWSPDGELITFARSWSEAGNAIVSEIAAINVDESLQSPSSAEERGTAPPLTVVSIIRTQNLRVFEPDWQSFTGAP